MKMVNVAQALSASAFTTARPRPAIAMIRMNRTAMPAVTPATGLTSVRAMSARERPFRRTDAQSQNESWTAPARQTPPTSQIRPGA